MAKYTEKAFKTILNKRKYIDGWFWDRYSINGYNGCQLGCVYCDSRSEKYYMPADFENDIIVKTGVKEMLDKRISNARTLLPDVVAMSGASDPYQPAEGVYKNTMQCLEVLAKHKYPVHMITKSKLVLRDLDVLEGIGADTWCTVSITITTADPDKAKFLEKRAPSPQERFKIIKTIKQTKKHIQTGVLLMPVVPGLCDRDHDLEQMVKETKESGADYLVFAPGMTMRDVQARWFMKHLSEAYPDLAPGYEKLYKFKYQPDIYTGEYTPNRNYGFKMGRKILALCEQYGLPYRIKRFIPMDYRRRNYRVAQALLDESYRLQMMGKAWTNKYWAAMNIQNLKESVTDIAGRNELHTIRNVDRDIERFIREFPEE
jgi:DNA repair photolyase